MFPRSVLLVIVFFISISAYAQQHPVEELVVTGQRTNNSIGNPHYNNVGIAANAIRYGTTWSNAAHAASAAAQAANKKQEEAAKKKWCKDNNYPTSVSFCSIFKIEAEAVKKFCQEMPAQIDIAVLDCVINARQYASILISRNCGDGAWDFGFSHKDSGFGVHYSSEVSAKFCREDVDHELVTSTLLCQSQGAKYKAALNQNCND